MIGYMKVVYDNYVLGVGIVDRQGNISRQEYDELTLIINGKPEAPEGYEYKLRDSDYQWELVKLPDPEPEDPDAEPSDFENQLSRLGVQL